MSIWKQPQPEPVRKKPKRTVPLQEDLPQCGCCMKKIKTKEYHHIEFLGVGFNVCPKCLKKWRRSNDISSNFGV